MPEINFSNYLKQIKHFSSRQFFFLSKSKGHLHAINKTKQTQISLKAPLTAAQTPNVLYS